MNTDDADKKLAQARKDWNNLYARKEVFRKRSVDLAVRAGTLEDTLRDVLNELAFFRMPAQYLPSVARAVQVLAECERNPVSVVTPTLVPSPHGADTSVGFKRNRFPQDS